MSVFFEEAVAADYDELLDVWEDSVRATHDFISEEDITNYKPLILEHAFPAVSLKYVREENGPIVGFVGVQDKKVEMLFLLDRVRGRGLGRDLLDHAVEMMGADRLDVNEQNPHAVAFYKHMGFEVVSRSPLDGQGKPFPILHMQLASDRNGRFVQDVLG